MNMHAVCISTAIAHERDCVCVYPKKASVKRGALTWLR